MDNEQRATIITKALAYVENGGKPKLGSLKAGHSGEMKSIFQFTPETWKRYAKEITKQKDLPNTPETEAAVVHGKVKQWLEKGYNEQQIASMWNAGDARPDAYLENHKGVNKYGVAYDTPGYAKKVQKYVDEFSKETQLPQMAQTSNSLSKPMNSMMAPNQPPQQNTQAPGDIGSLVKLATSNIK